MSVQPSDTQACARVVPRNFRAKSGVEIFDGVFLGKFLGAGVQAAVYELVFADGTTTGRVLKLGHESLSHRLLLGGMATSMMSLQKEWEIGMQLKAAIEDEEGKLPGFTRTCDCMAIHGDSRSKQVIFRGLMMEKIQGYSVAARVTDPTFHNIHYIREMLYQVFSALDTAQRLTGFCHADLGLNNVMEHYPVINPMLEEEQRSQNVDAMRKGEDQAPDSCIECEKSCTPGKDDTWSRMGNEGCKIPPPVCGWSCNVDGSKMPLGPNVEFKLIDYGVAEFNETLAHAAGGYEAEERLAAVHAKFGKRGIPVGATANEDMLRLMNDQGAKLTEKIVGSKRGKKQKRRGFLLKKAEDEDRFYVVPDDASTASSSQSVGNAAPSSGPGSPSLDNAMSNTRSVQAGVVEKMYRSFWSRKGDVFHLLLSLAITLDDRVWPKTDERDVQLFISLVHHITGVKMRAYFYSGDEGKSIKVMGRRWKKTVGDSDSEKSSMAYDAFAFGSRVRVFNWMRKFKMVIKAHLSPWNSGALAAEALVSPFFGPNRSPPHAELPVCVSAAFPFRRTSSIV
jgi:hypothetical protein